ncbi:BLUF domain-containing protein [Roseovarius salinarum]|uniref:BLUF domain-containing protein n=1 Tax=Roseovarius salinarum TaxID=1981892 RepID=UPI000C33DAEF|nr:BLUF domain-containing protein [Roseovarius salinarum]
MFFRRIYTSTAAPGTGEHAVGDILRRSRRNNAAAGLTGLLVFHQGRFFQVLEGPRPAVLACYGRISGDPRHGKMRLLDEGPAQQRAFGDWQMGYGRPQDLPAAQRDGVIAILDLVPPDSAARGADVQVRRAVRDFLSGFRHLPAGRRTA